MDNTYLSTKKLNFFNNELRDNSVWSGLTESNHLKNSFNIEDKDMSIMHTPTELEQIQEINRYEEAKKKEFKGEIWTDCSTKNHLIGSGEYNLEGKNSDLDIDKEEDICIGGKPFLDSVVDHPKHYNNYSVEVIDMMEKIYGVEKLMVFCELNAFKYRMRMGTKGNMQEDFEKEQWYLNKIKE